MIIGKIAPPRIADAGKFSVLSLLSLLLISCSSSENESSQEVAPPQDSVPERIVLQGSDLNNIGSGLLSLNADGPGGSPNQSLRSGDVLQGETSDDVLIGALGVDVLLGGDGNDVIIGGTEDFNANVDGDDNGSDNRDRAFGENGNDLFIWTPGDGSDFFDGGAGTDVIAFGLVGEQRDSDGSSSGAPFFNVNPPGSDGSLNFDGIFLDPVTKLPTISVSTSPGFCTVLDESTHPAELSTLALDHLVRFSLRGVADAFDAGTRSDDDGLRVALSLRNVEYVVCTSREVGDGGGVENIEVLDITNYPPTLASLSDLPAFIRQQIQ
ncbi:MAG: calcium-binding protein [Granulosicoccus sp.]